MADEKQTFSLDLDASEFIAKAADAKNAIGDIGNAENLSGLLEGLSSAGIALAAVGVAALALKGTFDTVFAAEQIQRTKNLFNQLSESVGVTGERLRSDLVNATHGLATETDVIQAANKALVSMGASAEKLPEIMDLARRYTMNFGGDLVENFEKMNQAIATGSARMLRHMGITIDTNKAIKDYAMANGHLADEITQAGRQQAVLNAVLDFGKTKFKDVAGAEEQALTTAAQFKVAIKEIGELFVVAFEKIAGPLVRSVMKSLADGAREVKDVLMSWLGDPAEKAAAKVDLLNLKIRETNETVAELEKRKKLGSTLAGDDILLEQSKKNLGKYHAELDELDKKREEHNKELLAKEVDLKKEANQDKFFDDDKTAKNDMKLQEEILRMKEKNNKDEIAGAENEAELNAALQQEQMLMEQEYTEKKKKLDDELHEGKIRNKEQYNQMLELMQQEHENKIAQIEDSRESRESRMLDNHLKKSQNMFDGIGRAAEVSAKRAEMAMNNFGKQGQMVVGTIQKRGSEAFLAFGKAVVDHSQSASQIMKGFFLNTLADIAQSQGELYLAMGIVDPSKFAAGAALLVLAGALRAMAGSSGGAIGGGGYSSGGGGGAFADQTQAASAAPAQAEKKTVTVQIQGNYFETEQTKTRLLEMIRESTDATDFKYVQIGQT